MEQEKRQTAARHAAAEYAPAPEGSAITYGLVAVAMFALVTWAVVTFYGLDSRPYLAYAGACAVLFFVAGYCLRKLRKRRHHAAYEEELARDSDSPPP